MNNKNRDNDLRIFITGFSGSLSEILFFLKREKSPKKESQDLKILIDTGATSCYIKKGVYNDAEE